MVREHWNKPPLSGGSITELPTSLSVRKYMELKGTNASGKSISSGKVTPEQFGSLSNVIPGKAHGMGALVLDSSRNIENINNLNTEGDITINSTTEDNYGKSLNFSKSRENIFEICRYAIFLQLLKD